jgi:hypothetical protein
MLDASDCRDIPSRVYFDDNGVRVVCLHRVQVVSRCLSKFGGIDGYEAERLRVHAERTSESAIVRRRAEMASALSARNCSPRSVDDVPMCREYVFSGRGDADEIAVIVNEFEFFREHTTYADEFRRVRDHDYAWRGRCVLSEVSRAAKGAALMKWACSFESFEVASTRLELPQSLVPALRVKARWW